MEEEKNLMAAAADLTKTEFETLMLTGLLIEEALEVAKRAEREQCALEAEQCGAHNVAAMIRARS